MMSAAFKVAVGAGIILGILGVSFALGRAFKIEDPFIATAVGFSCLLVTISVLGWCYMIGDAAL